VRVHREVTIERLLVEPDIRACLCGEQRSGYLVGVSGCPCDRRPAHARDARDEIWAEILADRVAAERKAESAGESRPAFSEIDDLRGSLALVEEPALVDEERGVDRARAKLFERARVRRDWHDDWLELGQEQAQHEVCRGAKSGHADALPREGRKR